MRRSTTLKRSIAVLVSSAVLAVPAWYQSVSNPRTSRLRRTKTPRLVGLSPMGTAGFEPPTRNSPTTRSPTPKIATDAVSSSKIVDQTVASADLAFESVGSEELQD